MTLSSAVVRRGEGSHRIHGAIVIVMVVAAFALVAIANGVMGVPRNDDWVYIRSAVELERTGVFHPFTSTALMVGQSLMGAGITHVLGVNVAALQIVVLVMGIIGLLANYLLFCGFLKPAAATASVLTIAAGPFFVNLGLSFMTDVPSYAFASLCLYVGWRALRADSVSIPLLAFSLLLGLIAFSIREFGISAPLAVVALLVWSARSRPHRRLPFVVVAMWAAVVVVLYLWRRGVAGGPSLGLTLMEAEPALGVTVRSFFTVALFLLPVVAGISWRRVGAMLGHRRRSLAMIATIFLVTMWFFVTSTGYRSALMGNYFTPQGAYSVTVPGDPAVVFPPSVWLGIGVIALVSAVAVLWSLGCLSGAALRTALGTTEPLARTALILSVLFVAIYGSAWIVSVLFLGSPYFDRNLVPVIPVAAAVLLGLMERAGVLKRLWLVFASGALAVIGVLGLVSTDAAASFDALKWQTASTVAASQGVPSALIDGGYEWVGMHREGIAESDRHSGDDRYSWWVRMFPAAPVCGTTYHPSAAETRAGRQIAQMSRVSLLGRSSSLIVLAGPDCTD